MTYPYFSVIIPAYSEGNLLHLSVRSILAQADQDFEIIIVDDGANLPTKAVINELAQQNLEKIRIIEQSNDGLSAARNRALRHAQGKYICFLDGDDTRHPLALQCVRQLLESQEVDVVFTGATVFTRDNETHPFYDDRVLKALLKISNSGVFSEKLGNLDPGCKYLGFLEPSSSTKFINSEFARKISLTYPNGLFFEDIFTHIQLCSSLTSFIVTRLPLFTYHLGYSHAQITSGSNERRFNALSSTFSALDLASRTTRFNDPDFRFSVMHGAARLLNWCEQEISHVHRHQFSRSLHYLFSRIPRHIIAQDDAGAVVPSCFRSLVEDPAMDFLRRYQKAWAL